MEDVKLIYEYIRREGTLQSPLLDCVWLTRVEVFQRTFRRVRALELRCEIIEEGTSDKITGYLLQSINRTDMK
jgi:hypothetical protein